MKLFDFTAVQNRTVPFPAPNRTFGLTSRSINDYGRNARAYSGNEIVFAAVEMLATSAGEPHIIGRKWRRESPRIGRTTAPAQADIRTSIRAEEERMRSRGLSIRAVKEHMISNGFFKELPAHPLVTLLREPNPWMSRGQLWGTVVMDQCLAGNSYLLKSRFQEGPLKGKVGELWRLRPDRVRIIPSKTDFIEGYEYGVGGRQEDKIIFPAKDIIHFKTRNPLDDYYGMPPLMPASGRVAIDEYMQIFLRGFYERGGTGPGAILTVDKKLTGPQKDEIRKRKDQVYSGPGGATEWMILDNAQTTFQHLGLDRGLRDALPQEIDALSETRIAMVFGIPGSILGLRIGYESSSYANKRQDWQVLWDLKMVPMLSDFDDVLNLQLVPEFGDIDEVLFDLSDIRALQEDVDKVQDRIRANVGAGLMAWEDGLEELGQDPNAVGSKTFFIPMGVNPTPGALVPQVALPGAPEDDPDEDEDQEEAEPAPAPEARLEIVAEVHCPECGRWLGRNMNIGATAFCPNDKEIIVGAPASAPQTTVKTIHRDGNGRIEEVVEVTS